ncbi:hypothetical protein QJS10_CPB11g00601 [Acorus calamus]|uniref:LysM domain-containing protein n=1 Tax=Acorus calamus TaxID=4465 RepID=A0AAV9DVV0_ACOCL|nr:hypothetical protein QJS10_CPB11g00601 [Acorus calamus]
MDRQSSKWSLAAALDGASLYCGLVLAFLILLGSLSRENTLVEAGNLRGGAFNGGRPCDEIYVVEEGETLHTISDKCGDPFIVEENPHIQDPDDVFPGLVIKITPYSNKPRKL